MKADAWGFRQKNAAWRLENFHRGIQGTQDCFNLNALHRVSNN